MHTSQMPGLLRQDLLFFFKLGEDAFNWRNNGGCVYLEVPKQLRPRENCQRQCSASGRTKHATDRTQVESTNDKLRSFVIPVFILCPVRHCFPYNSISCLFVTLVLCFSANGSLVHNKTCQTHTGVDSLPNAIQF